MGFNHLHCQKAAINTSNAGVEEAMNWLLAHMDDPDIDAPISQGAHGNEVDQTKVDTLLSFGFQEEIARKALKASRKLQIGYSTILMLLFHLTWTPPHQALNLLLTTLNYPMEEGDTGFLG
ncbi:hypothetical protein OIU78_025187 [Salix suchowensis]|nr:hypothetical protein OIU78_025187 [Salix suchowensis]